MHPPPSLLTPTNLPSPSELTPATPPPGFDYSSAVDTTGEHMSDLHFTLFQHHYVHLLPPLADQLHIPPNQDLTSLAAACCNYITHITSPLLPSLDLTHRHLITLTVALLLYSPPTRTLITSLLIPPPPSSNDHPSPLQHQPPLPQHQLLPPLPRPPPKAHSHPSNLHPLTLHPLPSLSHSAHKLHWTGISTIQP